MNQARYMDYLLRNAFRLKEEWDYDDNKKSFCLQKFLSFSQKAQLLSDIDFTIRFYENLPIIKKEIMILYYVESYLIKEIADKLHYSMSRVKAILKECREDYLEKLEVIYGRKN